MKQKKITHTMQKVAADILQDFEILLMTHQNNEPYAADEIIEIINKHEAGYALCRDPFTYMLCTSDEYAENSLEYAKDIMMSRYGHCDGLE